MADHYVYLVTRVATSSALTEEQVRKCTSDDPILQAVIQMTRDDCWFEIGKYDGQPGVDYEELLVYRSVKEEITVNDSRDIVIRNNKLVIPRNLQQQVLSLAHEGHQGVRKTKSYLRSRVWLPGTDTAVEKEVKQCIPCQANTGRGTVEPLRMSDLPRGPCRLLQTATLQRLSTSSEVLISVVDRVFSLFGYPEVVKSDNGPPFNGTKWAEYMKEYGVKHRKSTLLWPQSNAQAEGFNKPLMKAIKIAQRKGQKWLPAMNQFLRVYRSTPHVTTTFTPHRLLFGRNPGTKIPEVVQQPNHLDDKAVRAADSKAKGKMKEYADERANAKYSPVHGGDIVIVWQQRLNKLDPKYDQQSLTVVGGNGPMVTAKRLEHTIPTDNEPAMKWTLNTEQRT